MILNQKGKYIDAIQINEKNRFLRSDISFVLKAIPNNKAGTAKPKTALKFVNSPIASGISNEPKVCAVRKTFDKEISCLKPTDDPEKAKRKTAVAPSETAIFLLTVC